MNAGEDARERKEDDGRKVEKGGSEGLREREREREGGKVSGGGSKVEEVWVGSRVYA